MNYDDWKLMTPEEDYESRGGWICPECGSTSTDRCDFDFDEEDIIRLCPWEQANPEPDPDQLMEQRREDREMEAQLPHGWDD